MSKYLLLIFHSGSLSGPKLSMDDNLSSVLQHVTMQCEIQTHTVVPESYISRKSIQHLFLLFWIRYICFYAYIYFFILTGIPEN